MKLIFLVLLISACAHKPSRPLKMRYNSDPKGSLHELTIDSDTDQSELTFSHAAEVYTFNVCIKKNRLPEIKDQKFTSNQIFRRYMCEVENKEVKQTYRSMILDLCRKGDHHPDIETLCDKAIPAAKEL